MVVIARADREQNLQLKLIRIQFPDPLFTSQPIIFEDLVDLVTPWSLAAEIHILDASQRMFCAVFEHGSSGTTGIHVVLDWLKGQSFIYDTGIPYVSLSFFSRWYSILEFARHMVDQSQAFNSLKTNSTSYCAQSTGDPNSAVHSPSHICGSIPAPGRVSAGSRRKNCLSCRPSPSPQPNGCTTRSCSGITP